MNILDENIPADQYAILKNWRIPIHQIGVDIGRKGMKDNEIIFFLHKLSNITFFTRDLGFYNRNFNHNRYCLVCLAVKKNEVAVFMRYILRHPELDSKGKRMGPVIRISHAGFFILPQNNRKEIYITL